MDDNKIYIQSTSEYIGEVKPSFIKMTDKLKSVAQVVEQMDSPKKTKFETKKELTHELLETVSELRKVIAKTSDLGRHINNLAQDSHGKA